MTRIWAIWIVMATCVVLCGSCNSTLLFNPAFVNQQTGDVFPSHQRIGPGLSWPGRTIPPTKVSSS
jgi:hypothetical protein